MNKYPTQDNGVAFIFQGSYYLAAPWPIRSPKKALENYEKAVQVGAQRGGKRTNMCVCFLSLLHSERQHTWFASSCHADPTRAPVFVERRYDSYS